MNRYVFYSLLLRPIWGPLDWDLFAITALCLSCLSACLVATHLSDRTYGHELACLTGFQLLMVTIPFLIIGWGTPRSEGPFVPGFVDESILTPGSPAFERIAPWL